MFRAIPVFSAVLALPCFRLFRTGHRVCGAEAWLERVSTRAVPASV